MTKKGKIISAIALSLTIVGVGALFVSTYVLPIINAHRQLNEDLSNINNSVLNDVSLKVNQDNAFDFEQDSDNEDYNQYWHWNDLFGNLYLMRYAQDFTGWSDGSTYKTWQFQSNAQLELQSANLLEITGSRVQFTQSDNGHPLPVASVEWDSIFHSPSLPDITNHVSSDSVCEIGFEAERTNLDLLVYKMYFIDIYDVKISFPLSSGIGDILNFKLTFYPFRLEDFVDTYTVVQTFVALPYNQSTTVYNQYTWLSRSFKLLNIFDTKFVYIDGQYFEWYSILDGIELLRMGFGAIQTFLDFQILPNITLGAIVVIPFIATLLIGLIRIIQG